MVKIREPNPSALSDAEKAAKAEKWGNEAIPKVPRAKPYKSINIPFNTEADYQRLIKAAQASNRKPTDFMKAAIKSAIDKHLIQH
jgi:hypothetical protein